MSPISCKSGLTLISIFLLIELIYYYFEFKLSKSHYVTIKDDHDIETDPIKYIYLYMNWKKNERRMEMWNLKATVPYRIREHMGEVFEKISIPSFDSLSLETSIKVDWLPKYFEESSYELQNFMMVYSEMYNFGIENLKLELKFRKELIQRSQNMLRDYQITTSNFVCMHYKASENKPTIHNAPATYKFYVLAMNHFKTKYNNLTFILIARDIGWLKENLSPIINNGFVIVNPLKPSDLNGIFALSETCNYTVLNCGDFPTTSALFTGGETVIYSNEKKRSNNLQYGDAIAVAQSMRRNEWLIGNDSFIGTFKDFY